MTSEAELALAVFEAAALEGLDQLAEDLAATDDATVAEILLLTWSRRIQTEAQRLLDESGGKIH